MRETRVIGAVDIGGTKIAVGAVREDGTILSRFECATRAEQGLGAAVERVRKMLRQAAEEVRFPFDGIGIACPGPLDPLTGTIGDAGTLPGWRGRNLVTELENEFGVSVAMENDADAAALAEANWGGFEGFKSLIYVTVSTGIGGGIILPGKKLYRGVEGAHPEIGHQVIDPSGPLCYCNARGCWESLASGPAMASWFREQEASVSELTGAEICVRAQQGDVLAQRAVDREGYYLGLGLANLITLFAPDAVVLGGGLMKSSHLFWERALAVVRRVCTQVPLEKTEIRLASLGYDVGLAGAAQAWLHRNS